MGGSTLNVLNGVNLSVKKGEFLCVMGPSGAGKSTLLHILGALDHPTSGAVTLAGRDVFTITERELPAFRNAHIGFVFQFHHLLTEFTALENVMMPLLVGRKSAAEAKKRAEAELERVGLAGRTLHKPGELSGGEQQRVAIARALVTSPDIVLADEPTGNLDTKTGSDVFDLMRRFNRESGTTFIMVTHNETLAARCDRLVRMVDGMMSLTRMSKSDTVG
ncbi:MAG: ABC transporter ATP-binding protein [Nitrospirae bacterium]|nr:ABC transporter ATP-binding protein [Nitrospirota bacterium]